MDPLQDWYVFLSQLSATLGGPLGQLADRIQFPLVNALLLGMFGATAPCQLTTNLSAIAYVSRRPGEGRPWQKAVTYTLGQVVLYTGIGGMVIGLGLQIAASAVPVVVVARKLLGPLMLLIGLTFLGLLTLRMSLGQRCVERLRSRMPAKGPWGPFIMGVSFAFAFSPTLFLLFFGLAIPLGLRSNTGFLVPGLFAVGTALPLLASAGFLSAGNELAGTFASRLSWGHSILKKVAGVIFILAGINDTLTYWFL